MSAISRSAHGLSTPVAEHWRARAACRNEDPDLFFREGARQEALHICRAHCPVLRECQEDARAFPPRHGVQAGEAWSANGGLLYGGVLQPVRRCHRCPTTPPVLEPGRVGYRPRRQIPTAEPGPAGLTDAEAQLARLLCASDQPAKRIGKQLGISINTLKAHMRAIYSKVGVNSRQELCASPLMKETVCDR